MKHLLVRTIVLACVATRAMTAQQPTSATSASSVIAHLSVGGHERNYIVDLPPGYAPAKAYPLILDFHGGGGNPAGARKQSGFSDLAARVGAIVVYPAGTGPLAGRLLTWNTVTCCGYAQRTGVDEVAFVRALLDTLQAKYSIDGKRIYAAGLSNGGMMAHLIGCRMSDRIAAIAVISGELTTECTPARPVSVLMIHGTADENLPYNGGLGSRALDKHDVRPVAYAVNAWRTADRCSAPPAITKSASVTHSVSAPCAARTAVELYTIEGGGHAWPGGQRMSRLLDAPSTALDATQVAWDFFVAHPRR